MVPPIEKKALLEKIWGHLKLLVLEEVSMISPNLYNMLLYRSFHGRRTQFTVEEAGYLTRACAFGRLPIVLYLGDFLQLKPTGTGLSLLSSFSTLDDPSQQSAPPAEHQQAMKFFCATPICFELQASNRFKDKELTDLMNFMRTPTSAALPANIAKTWRKIQMRLRDARLREERFQNGHMLAWFWDTVARWVTMRAKRDAATLNQLLYLVQAADASVPPMDLAAKLMNKVNPGDTGGMHGILPLHIGMRVRLLDHLDIKSSLVKDAEGEVVHIAINPEDEAEVAGARAAGRPAYLRHLPYGVWVRMDKYTAAPFCEHLKKHYGSLTREHTSRLVFIEPQTSNTFEFRRHKVTRTGFPISHAMALTSTACQGRTMPLGVIIDAGCKDESDHDSLWLHKDSDISVQLLRSL